MKEEKKKETVSFEIKNPMLLVFIAFAICVIVLELSVITNRPIAFGDGAYHAYIAKYIGESETFPKVLPGLNSYYTYAPLLHLLLSIFYLAPFGEILAKVFIPLLVFITGLATFVTVSRIFSRRAAFLISVLILTIPIFVTYSVLIYTDILMILFFVLSAMFTLIAENDGNKKYWILAVIFAGMSFLSKTTGVVSFGFVGIVLLYKLARKELNSKEFLKLSIFIGVVAVLVVGGWFIRNMLYFGTLDCNLPLMKGNCTKEYVNPEVGTKFAGYVTPSGSNVGVLDFGLKNFVEFMFGNMWIVPLALFSGIIFAVSRKEKSDYLNILLLILALLPATFVVVQSSFTMRVEDVGRYMMLSVFVLPLVAAVFIDKFLGFFGRYWKYLPAIFIVIIMIFSWMNFKAKLDTMSQVTQFSPAFFQACDFIKANTEKDAKLLTLWAAPTIYNCERTAGWESNNLPDIVLSQDLPKVMDGLKNQSIDYIFIQKFAMSQVAYQASIPINFVQFLNDNPNHFVNIYENGPKLQDCISQGGCDGTIVYKIKY